MKQENHLSPPVYFLFDKNILVAVAKTSYAVIFPFLLWSNTRAKDESSYPVGIKCLFIPLYVSIIHLAKSEGSS